MVAIPILGGTPKAPYKKYSKADVVRVYGKPLSLEMKAMARQAESRLEAAEILLDIYQDTKHKLTEELLNMQDTGMMVMNYDIYEKADNFCHLCMEYEIALIEVVEYYRKVDKK
jgi:hypothetical protein